VPGLDALDDLIAYEIADKAIPSLSYALFDRHEIIASRHHSLSGGIDDKTIFRIGSVSKTFAAIQAMQLIARGKLDLDVPVTRWLPLFRPRDPLLGPTAPTLRQLLSHRSGLTREAGRGHYLDDAPPPLDEIVDSIADFPLKAPGDGSAYFYSNVGYAAVSAIIERASGRRYADNLAATILTPLGLADTAIALDPATRAALAPALLWDIDHDYPAPVFDLGGPAAGNIYATLGDLARYGQALLDGDGALLPRPLLDSMWTPAGSATAERGYGLGFAVDTLDGHRSVGHGGVVYGYASSLQLLPDAGLGVVVFATLECSNDIIGRIGRRALRHALARRGGKEPPPARRLPPAGAVAGQLLAGWYTSDDGEAIELRARDERLYLIDDGVPLEIRPLAPNSFALDGRIFGEESSQAYPVFREQADQLRWKGKLWRRSAEPVVPASDLTPQLGAYGPSFLPTFLTAAADGLHCRMELVAPHRCERIDERRFILRGGMYDRETLQLGLLGANGRPAIRVGAMLLERLPLA
jgi:D-alanyl-D-alanine dipeptidase